MIERKLCIFCLFFFAAGFLFLQLNGGSIPGEKKPPPGAACFQEDDRIVLKGQVWKKEKRSDYTVLYLRDNCLSKNGRSVYESGMILYDPCDRKVQRGNLICAEGSLFFFDQARNPGNFDQEFYYEKQNIHAGMWVKQLEVEDYRSWKIRNALDKWRAAWKQSLLEGAGEPYGGILSAMILGERREMDQEIKEQYQISGIAHVLSISGLHLSLIGAGIYRFFRRCTGSYLAGGMAGISFLLLYILMIGLGVSVLRALVMFLFRVGADMSGRVYDMPTALSAAAVVVVLWRPLSYYDGGFQLSFGAVAGIWTVGKIWKKSKSRLSEMLKMSTGVQLAVLPVTLYHYFEFSPYTVLLNLIVIPLMSVLLLFGMAGSLLYAASCPAGPLLLWICRRILDLYGLSCKGVLSLPLGRMVTGRPDAAAVLYYYLAVGLCVFLWSRIGKRKRKRKISLGERLQAVLPVLMGVLVLLFAGCADRQGMLEVTALDVGQGDCVFLRMPDGTAILVDGGSSDVDQVGRYRIEPYVKEQGAGTLDYVFVTHGDFDHMNGIREMLQRQETGIRIRCLLLPSRQFWDETLQELALIAKACHTEVVCMERGEQLAAGTCRITCLQPGPEDGMAPGNSASMILDLTYGSFDMLLTGDVEQEGEERLCERLHKNYDVLKVAHHGSETSTSQVFLDTISPAQAVISAGRNNPYGHPHRKTLERLGNESCRVWQTADSGAVTFLTDGKSMSICSFLSKTY